MPQRTYPQNIIAGLVMASFVMTAICGLLSPFVPQTSAATVSQGVNVTALVLPTAPTEPAVIDETLDDQVLTTTVFVLRGRCQPNTLVRVFNRGVLIGTVMGSSDGEFVMNVTLDEGENILTALNYDEFDQPGPASPPIIITVNSPDPVANPKEVTGTIDSNGVITTSASAANETTPSPEGTKAAKRDYQRAFEGTLAEPIAKALNVSNVVSPSFNNAVSITLNGLFIAAVLGLLAILLL